MQLQYFLIFPVFYNPLDGTLGLFLVSCCCCGTGYDQLKPMKLCKSVLPKDIWNAPLQPDLPPVHLSTVNWSGGDQSPVPRELNQELHTLARTATTGWTLHFTSWHYQSLFLPSAKRYCPGPHSREEENTQRIPQTRWKPPSAGSSFIMVYADTYVYGELNYSLVYWWVLCIGGLVCALNFCYLQLSIEQKVILVNAGATNAVIQSVKVSGCHALQASEWIVHMQYQLFCSSKLYTADTEYISLSMKRSPSMCQLC